MSDRDRRSGNLSAWNVAVQQRHNFLYKRKKALLRGVGCLAGIERGGNAYQGTVAAVHLDGIFHQVVL